MKFIYSNGGYAREFARLVRHSDPSHNIVFIDDHPSDGAVSFDDAISMGAGQEAGILIGFADGKLRQQKTQRARDAGFRIESVSAPTSLIGDNISLGPGAILSDFSMITADTRIGAGFQCNIYSYVAHDCEVGDFVTLAPRVSVNGRVEIEDYAYIGTGATVLPGAAGAPIRIGQGAVVGAHSLVTKDVPAEATVVGTPARPIGSTA